MRINKCDNWEERKKMLDENGWILDIAQDGYYLRYRNGKSWYVGTSSFMNLSDDEFLDFIHQYSLKNTDAINPLSCYNDGKNIEVNDFIANKNLNFFRGNVVKYIVRAGKQDPSREVEDLKKAQWYIGREIERMEGKA